MTSFFIHNAIRNAQDACRDIIMAYEAYKSSVLEETKTYIVATVNFLVGRHKIYAEADALSKLKRKYESQDTIPLEQLLAGEYGTQLEKVRHYTAQCDGLDNTMGDKRAKECNIPLLVRECFDASIVLEGNARATLAIEPVFMRAANELVHNMNGKSLTQADTQNVYALFANLMHNRLPALVNVLDCRAHSYVFVNELIQLLIALQDAQLDTNTHNENGQLIVDLTRVCSAYETNNSALQHRYAEVKLSEFPFSITDNTYVASADAVLATQIMLTMIAQRELSEIIMHQELNLIPERLIYDYFVGTQPLHLTTPGDVSGLVERPTTELAHLLLVYRLKHMLHLRITYLILQKYYDHLTYLLKHKVAHNAQSAKSKLLADLLAQSGQIAYAIAEDMLLNIRAKIVLHIIKIQRPITLGNMMKLTNELLSDKIKDLRAYITHDSIKHTLSVKRLGKVIASVLRDRPQERYKLRKDRIFDNLIHEIFTSESNSKFTQYLCSRADCFIVGLCSDSELMEQIGNIVMSASFIETIYTSVQQVKHGPQATVSMPGTQVGNRIVPQQADSGSETDTEVEMPVVQDNEDEIRFVIDPSRHAHNRESGTCKIPDVRKAIRQLIEQSEPIIEDTETICRITCQDNVPYTRGFDRQLNILNVANTVIIERNMLQGIHLPYFAVSGALMLADCALYAHLKSSLWRHATDTVNTAVKFTQYAYKLTAVGMLAAFGIRAIILHRYNI